MIKKILLVSGLALVSTCALADDCSADLSNVQSQMINTCGQLGSADASQCALTMANQAVDSCINSNSSGSLFGQAPPPNPSTNPPQHATPQTQTAATATLNQSDNTNSQNNAKSHHKKSDWYF